MNARTGHGSAGNSGLRWELHRGHDLRADALERRREIGTAATGLSTLSETLREEVDGFVTSIRAA